MSLLDPDGEGIMPIFPLCAIIFGLATLFHGRHFSRLFCFILGFALGGTWVYYIIQQHTEVRHQGIPLLLGVLGATIGAVICLLAHLLTLGLIMGYVGAAIILIIDSSTVFATWEHRLVLMTILMIFAAVMALRHQKFSILASTILAGAFITVLGVDHFSGRAFTSVLFHDTILDYPLTVPAVVPTCTWTCVCMILLFFALVACGVMTHHYMDLIPTDDDAEERVALLGDKTLESEAGAYQTFQTTKHQHKVSTPKTPNAGSEPVTLANKADFNYFELDHLPPNLRGIFMSLDSNFQALQTQFGFQSSSVSNQLEHMMFLVGNVTSHNHTDAVTRIHNKLFANYREWCTFLTVPAQICPERADRATTDQKLNEIALWLLIWGEAASLRHMPECLCYLFHNMSGEIRSLGDRPAPTRPVHSFLKDVIRPLYDILRSEKGDIHTVMRNYDDINEFFWSHECLQYFYGNPGYNRGEATDVEQGRTTIPPSVATGLKNFPKTYLERRSWLHPLRTFHRVAVVYAVAFHLLVCLAFMSHMNIPWLGQFANQILSSFVITLSFMSILKELLDVWGMYPIIEHSIENTIGAIMRLTIKSLFFGYLLLFYYWTWARTMDYYDAYKILAIVYCIPYGFHLLCTLFPSLSTMTRNNRYPILTSVLKFWYPTHQLYVGKNIHEPESLTYRYQIFWVTLLATKFFFSYLFQIEPLIDPTFGLYNMDHLMNGQDVEHMAYPSVRYLMILILWLPFILVYMFDAIIWYAVWQAVVGVMVGMAQHIGEIRSFSGLMASFLHAPYEFDKKLIGATSSAKKAHLAHELAPRDASGVRSSPVPVYDPHTHTSSSPPLLLERFTGPQWHAFAQAWNEIVADIRNSDLISNEEKQMLIFRFVAKSQKQFYLPLFLTAGTIEHAMDICTDRQHEYNNANNDADRIELEHSLAAYFNQRPFQREAITELWEHSVWVMEHLLGERHIPTLHTVFTKIYSFLDDMSLLKSMDMKKMSSIKQALLNLVRCLRIAEASFAAMRLKQAKKREQSRKKREQQKAEHGSMSSLQRKRDKDLKNLFKSPSSGTLSMLEKIRSRSEVPSSSVPDEDRQYTILHVNLIRDQVTTLLNALSGCVKDVGDARTVIANRLREVTVDQKGFLWDDNYAIKQVQQFLKDPKSTIVLTTLHAYGTLAAIDAEPKSLEARRRLLFFGNSLFMNMPAAAAVRNMYSFTTLTPFHSEDVLYSHSDLEKETEDGVSVFLYLQTIYPNEWANFVQRIGAGDSGVSQKTIEARMWASSRGQTLGRTVDGMMMYEKALQLLGKLEEPSTTDHDLQSLVKQKFQYVVSCQVYGKQKREMDPKAADIELLLAKYPNLRVAYIDQVKINQQDANGKAIVVDDFYSVLIKSIRTRYGTNEVREVYRIKLPGNPVIGEGKPENQNHAMIFTRGEVVQTIDMNQDNYFEEALKMRNLLQEFDHPTSSKPIAIMGFRENIYTGSLSSIANYMALQEGCFVTLGQRVLAEPLRIRLHYGHPDLFDKLFVMSRGGVSKATKSLNLSEDIFAGFNAVLRGGAVEMKEYVQVGKGRDVGLQQLFKFEAKLSQGAAMQSLSRDVYRMAQLMDWFRLCSFYFGGLGFYISNSLTIAALFLFLYSRLILAAFGMENDHTFSGAETISFWFGQIGFLLTLPVFGSLGVEKGFRAAAMDVCRMLVTGGPLFFIFHMGTKAHYFQQTLLAGGAKYRPTGRGFVTRHEDFSEIYRFHATSHFYQATEIMLLLILYSFVTPPGASYGLVTWAAWLVVVSWLFGPFWFNPMAFEYEKTIQDFVNFLEWMSRAEGDGDRSWKAWWREEVAFYRELEWHRRVWPAIFSLRHTLVGLSMIYWNSITSFQLLIGAIFMIIFLMLIRAARQKFSVEQTPYFRGIKALTVLSIFVGTLFIMAWYHVTGGQIASGFATALSIIYMTAGLCSALTCLGIQSKLLERWFKLFDYVIASFILLVLGLLSILLVPSTIQTRLMFYNAFSRGVLIDKLLKSKEERKTAQRVKERVVKSDSSSPTSESEEEEEQEQKHQHAAAVASESYQKRAKHQFLAPDMDDADASSEDTMNTDEEHPTILVTSHDTTSKRSSLQKSNSNENISNGTGGLKKNNSVTFKPEDDDDEEERKADQDDGVGTGLGAGKYHYGSGPRLNTSASGTVLDSLAEVDTDSSTSSPALSGIGGRSSPALAQFGSGPIPPTTLGSRNSSFNTGPDGLGSRQSSLTSPSPPIESGLGSRQSSLPGTGPLPPTITTPTSNSPAHAQIVRASSPNPSRHFPPVQTPQGGHVPASH